jgi:hypothetical protein
MPEGMNVEVAEPRQRNSTAMCPSNHSAAAVTSTTRMSCQIPRQTAREPGWNHPAGAAPMLLRWGR